MIKKALKSAIGLSIGVALGMCLAPRAFFEDSYVEILNDVWKQILIILPFSFLVCFLAGLFAFWLLSKLNKHL